MNKKIFLIILFLIIFPIININAQDIHFGWSFGVLNAYYDIINKNNKFNGDIEILKFNWIFDMYNIDLGFNAITLYTTPDDDDENGIYRYTILPLEITYIPFYYKFNENTQLWFSVYGKTGWYRTNDTDNGRIRNTIYGAIGSELSFRIKPEFIKIPGIRNNYLRCFSLYMEYNRFNELKIGFNADMTAFFYLIGLIAWNKN